MDNRPLMRGVSTVEEDWPGKGGPSMEATDGNFIDVLRSHGLQVTHQRLAVYQELYNSKEEHPDAEMIYREVRKRFPMISLGTVYKTLERFAEVKLVRKVSPTTEVARYDADLTTHHHLVCLDCQRITNISQGEMGQEIQIPKHGEFQILHYQLVFQGYCPTCVQDRADGAGVLT
jgi:Fur family transcriptional regulator, peroxide stress response regulator